MNPDILIDPAITDLQNRAKEDCVTISGLIKEIEILKKQCAYNAKQFEYLVTQIERLKEDKK